MPHDRPADAALAVILAIVAGIALGLMAFAAMAVGPDYATTAPAVAVAED